MADYIELANAYYKLLRWVDGAEVKKKNTALRSLDRIMHFLNESNVELIDLTAQPFSEGWAVKVMKMDDTVPENELFFTRMVKPIIQINGELVQEGEVYVGRLELNPVESAPLADNTQVDTNPPADAADVADTAHDVPVDEDSIEATTKSSLLQKLRAKLTNLHLSPIHWGFVGVAAVAFVSLIVSICALCNLADIQTDIAETDQQVKQILLANDQNQPDERSIVTYKFQKGEEIILITQPIGEKVQSTVDINGVSVMFTTETMLETDGE